MYLTKINGVLHSQLVHVIHYAVAFCMDIKEEHNYTTLIDNSYTPQLQLLYGEKLSFISLPY